MGYIESFTTLLADGINNEQFLSSVGHLKFVRKLSSRGPHWNLSYQPSLNYWACKNLGNLELVNCGLSKRATNSVDLGGLSFLEELDLSGNNFFRLPSGIGILSRLRLLRVAFCRNLVSIPELPSNLEHLDARSCISMRTVRLPIQAKKYLDLDLFGCPQLKEIRGMEGLISNHGWIIRSVPYCMLPNNYKKSLVKVIFLSLVHTNKHTIGTYYIFIN
jgi:hypothetical protein